MPKCHSTNDIALDLVRKQGVPEGTLVITDHQTDGKGQRGNAWNSGKNQNITMSIVLKPSFLPVYHQFQLTIVISLAVTDTIAQTVPDKVEIKWPNDIYVRSGKLGGILIENSIMGNQINHSVVGIGLNVNQKEFPIGLNAISISNLTNKSLDLEDLVGALCENIEKRYFQLRAGNYEELLNDYYKRLLGYQTERHFQSDHIFRGRIIGIDDSGKLLIETNNEIKRYGMKEIGFIFDNAL